MDVKPPSIRRKRARAVVALLTLVVGVPAGAVAWRRGGGNLGVVEPGRIYRSAQLDPPALAEFIRRHGIKTVLNLRGPNPQKAWYQSELQSTLAAGATQVDMPLASDQWLAREQAKALVEVLDSSEYPILIHCEFGAERTGLVSALAALLKPGSTLADGRRQFSIEYLFIAFKEGRVMQAHLDAYERWLHQQSRPHTSAAAREWLAGAYTPEEPSREFWPCNPYPLWVRHQPGGALQVAWPGRACSERVAIEVARRERR